MISLVIFSAVVLVLGGLALQVAKRGTRATDQALSMSVMVGRVDRASTVEFDSLANVVGCDTTVSGNLLIIGCTTVTAVSPRLMNVQVIVKTTAPMARPDTISFERGKERRPIPLQ
jgi:hypothetical protein